MCTGERFPLAQYIWSSGPVDFLQLSNLCDKNCASYEPVINHIISVHAVKDESKRIDGHMNQVQLKEVVSRRPLCHMRHVFHREAQKEIRKKSESGSAFELFRSTVNHKFLKSSKVQKLPVK